MSLPDKRILTGMVIGAMAATALAAVGPGISFDAFAEEQPVGLDMGNLVRFEGEAYSVTYEDSVATDPLERVQVRKIGYGQTSFVDITRTETGTYSSEALFSPHVRYPGIHVEEVADPARRYFGSMSFWTEAGWVEMPLGNADSVTIINRNAFGAAVTGNGFTCIFSRVAAVC